MPELHEALLEAHVQHELQRFRGAALDARMSGWTRALFAWLADVKLDDLVDASQVMGIIERYVIELRVSGGIMELTGEMSQLVLDAPASADTRLDQLLVDADYERFVTHIARLSGVWRELIARIAHSEAAEVVHANLLARLLGDVLHDHRLHGLLRQGLSRLEARIARVLSDQMSKRRQAMARRREERLLELLDPELVRSVVDELWASLGTMPLSTLFQLISKQDIEDFVVIGHEFWLGYRRSPYFHRISETLVAHFFAKYGQQSVAALIEDMGVSEAMLEHELRELVAPVLAEAGRTGLLERLLREQLGSFYGSPALRELLARA